jgi:DNA-binding transcriptional ArsR family regulator
MPVNPYPHPSADEVDLVEVLRALADPVRLRIVARLTDGEYHPCGVEEYGLEIHKSTLSHHFKTLREAGITATLVRGRNHGVRLRRGELEARFPGVLDSIVAAAATVASAAG